MGPAIIKGDQNLIHNAFLFYPLWTDSSGRQFLGSSEIPEDGAPDRVIANSTVHPHLGFLLCTLSLLLFFFSIPQGHFPNK